jgi:hypothetical protein
MAAAAQGLGRQAVVGEIRRLNMTEGYPTVLCEPHFAQWRFWCRFCRRYHLHSAGEGHRVAHCVDDQSPYRRTGYVLALDPLHRPTPGSMTPQREAILAVLRQAGRPMRPIEIAGALNRSPADIEKALLSMRGNGFVVHAAYGQWGAPSGA